MRILLAVTTILIFATGCSSSKETDLMESANNASGPLANQNENMPGMQSDDPEPNNPNTPDSNDPDASEQNTASTTINASNYEEVLKDVVRVLNLEDIDNFRNDTYLTERELFGGDVNVLAGEPALSGLEFLSEEVILETDVTRSIIKRQYACLSGGSFSLDNVDYRGAPISKRNITFNSCNYMGNDYSGSYGKSSGRRTNQIDTFDNFTHVKDNQTQSLTGVRDDVYQFVYNAEDINWNGVSFNLSSDAKSTTVTGMEWQRTGFNSLEMETEQYTVIDSIGQEQLVNSITYKSSLNADFQLMSPSTAQLAVSVSANLDFRQDYFNWVDNYLITTPEPDYPVSDLGTPLVIVRPDATRTFENLPFNKLANWQSGVISVVAEDGSRVTLQPSADDATKVLIELNESGEQMLRNWTDGFSVYCSKLISGCGDNAIELR